MTPSIALCCNVYNDADALRGMLETGSRFFDNIFIVHSGPGGAYSTDGTIEVAEKAGATIVFDDIQKGYGVIRTRLIHDCGCTWAFILDADERFFPTLPALHCEGTEYYPASENPNLSVHHRNGAWESDATINQGALVRRLISDPQWMAIRTTRRHWFDLGMRKPTQNWLRIRDHQLRIVRNLPELGYLRERKMHESLCDTRTGLDPQFPEQDDYLGPFHDHFHMHFRRATPGHKEFNEENYARLQLGQEMVPRT